MKSLKLQMRSLNFSLRIILLEKQAGLIILLIWLLSPLLVWNEIRFLVHDNLNSNVPWILNLIHSGKMYAPPTANLDHVFDGLPRFAFQPEFSFYVLCFALFPAKIAYFFHYCFMHCMAYLGMLLLCKHYVITNQTRLGVLLTSAVALCFATLPFWPSGSLAIAGMPLLTWALLNIGYNTKSKISWLTVILFPFFAYTLFFSTLWYIFCAFAIIGVVFFLKPKHRSALKRILLPLLVILLISALIDYRLFYNQFVLKVPSHRTLWHLATLNFKGVVGITFLHFLFGQHHFHSAHLSIIALSIATFFYFRKHLSQIKIIAIILLIIITMSFLGVVQDWTVFKAMVAKTPANGLNLRFFALAPFFWYVLLAVLIRKTLQEKNKYLIATSVVLLLINLTQLLFSIGISDYYGSRFVENIFANTYFHRSVESEKWETYFMPEKISGIGTIVPKGEKVLSIGITNEILQYAGYKTCGAYQYFIPLKSLNNYYSIFECKHDSIYDTGSVVETMVAELQSKNCNISAKVLANTFDCHYIISTNKVNVDGKYELKEIDNLYLYCLH